MIKFTVILCEDDADESPDGRRIEKQFQMLVLPRIGEEITFTGEGHCEKVSAICHCCFKQRDRPSITVFCYNVPIANLWCLHGHDEWKIVEGIDEKWFFEGYEEWKDS